MRWVRRIAGVVGIVLLLAVAWLAWSTLSALDWDRRHTAATAALPELSEKSEGLVRIDANGMTFRARVAGLDGEREPIVMLHGFPETSVMWSHVMAAAAAAGHPVVAFDQRGYSPGARPEEIDAYRIPELIGDVVAVADAAGFERFHLVGHDWGCVVGWSVAIQHPERVLSWSGMSIPHPGALLSDLREAGVPSYIRVFTAPMVPETMLGMNDLGNLMAGHEDATAEQQAEYAAVFAEPGALTGALDWYRALTASLDDPDAETVTGPVTVPTLFVYGDDEMWVTEPALERQRELVQAPNREIEVEAGHFVVREQPAAVTEAVLAHVSAPR